MELTYLELLEKEELQLMQTLSKNRNSQRNIYVSEWEKKYNIKVGNQVCFVNFNTPIMGILTGFEFDGCKISYPIITKHRKDGLLGSYKIKVYNHSLHTLKKC